MQPGERRLHLGLEARGTREATASGPLGQVVEERRLADAWVPAEDEGLTLPRLCSREQPIEGCAFR
jgi:hypothetical protein